jgi:endoplasmic reticulum lectin 1
VSLRQFHEDKNKEGKVIKSLEFLLGKFDSKGSLPPSTVDVPPTWFYVNKNYPYYEITLENGSPCDIRESTNRLTHLLFICDSEQSPVASLVMIKETTTCEYQAVVATSQLCQNSLYQIKKKPVHPIQCHAVDGGPSKPIRLDHHERQMKELFSGDSSEQSIQSKMNPVFSRSNSNNLPQDETFVANFLNGDACLIGVSVY